MPQRFTTVIYLIGQPLLLNAVSVPATAYIIRQMGPRPYGEWLIAVSLIGAVGFLSNLGLRTLFVRDVAQEPERAAAALAYQLGLRSALALTAGVLALLLCLCLRYPPVVLECVALAAFGLLLGTLAIAGADVLQGFQRFQSYASINLISGLLVTVASVVAVAIHPGAVELSIAYLVQPITSLLFLMRVHRQLFPVRIQWNLTRFREMLHEVRALGLSLFLASMQDQIDKLLVPKLTNITAFGYFGAGSMPANRLIAFPDGLSTALYPAISRSAIEGEKDASPHVVQLLAMSLVVCIPLAVLVAFLAPAIAEILFPHNKPTICRDIMRMTIWSVPLLGISYPMSYALQAVGSQNGAARASMFATIIGIALSCFLVVRHGVVGACWSSVARPMLSILFLSPLFIRTFPSVLPRIPILRVLLCAAIMTVPMWSSGHWLHPGLLRPVTGGLVAIGAYLGALVLLRVVKASDLREILRSRRPASAD